MNIFAIVRIGERKRVFYKFVCDFRRYLKESAKIFYQFRNKLVGVYLKIFFQKIKYNFSPGTEFTQQKNHVIIIIKTYSQRWKNIFVLAADELIQHAIVWFILDHFMVTPNIVFVWKYYAVKNKSISAKIM